MKFHVYCTSGDVIKEYKKMSTLLKKETINTNKIWVLNIETLEEFINFIDLWGGEVVVNLGKPYSTIELYNNYRE